MDALISLRKKIYGLQESGSPVAKALLTIVLAFYRMLDRLLLRRASRPDTRSEKLISQDKRFLCVLVPKSGSRTIISGLRNASKSQEFLLRVRETPIDHFVGQVPDGFVTFAFVRDPWSRAYSCYVQKIQQWTPIKAALHANGREGLFEGMAFEEFIHWLVSDHGRDEIADRHWISQYLVLGIDKGIVYDFIGHLESMDQDLRAISQRIGIEAGMFEHRLQTSAPEEYLSHYTPELVDMIASRYREDIEYFGYAAPKV